MKKWIVAVTVMLPTLIEIVDTSVVNVSLDHIRGSLSAGIDESTWTITSYLVSNAVIIPLTAWLSRLFGRKRYLLFSLSLPFPLARILKHRPLQPRHRRPGRRLDQGGGHQRRDAE